MPQGNFKSKKAHPVPQKEKKKKQTNLKKKGGRVIAPKKNRIIENMKVKKELQKAINSNIEEAMKARASQEPTSFKILKSSSGSEEKKKGSQK
ncbi:uncharacterized protein LOC143036930 isoform X1 [Oratosquilla oratoria]|uniref:uncharacterized protein LOC143036930 isoform X1 n=1 Tax=Oratosquilla oratoria TaxID=337810 RepID=UPI003F76039A